MFVFISDFFLSFGDFLSGLVKIRVEGSVEGFGRFGYVGCCYIDEVFGIVVSSFWD